MGKNEAIQLAAHLGNHTPVLYTGGVIKGYTVIPNDDIKLGNVFVMDGFLWKIEEICDPKNEELTTITITLIREVLSDGSPD